MQDINTEKDIQFIVDHFYKKVFEDEIIGEIFNQIIKSKMKDHLPIMYQFWQSIVLGTNEYKGNAIEKHLAINRTIPLKKQHFDRWLLLFNQSIDENFMGDLANKMKNSAYSISVVMQSKLHANKQ